MLTYTYYANEQVRTIAQDGVSKTRLWIAQRRRAVLVRRGTLLVMRVNGDRMCGTVLACFGRIVR